MSSRLPAQPVIATVDHPPPKPVAALFPSRENRMRWENYLTRELLAVGDRVKTGVVTAAFDIDGFRVELSSFDFVAQRPIGEVLRWVITQLEHGIVHITHPRYFGLFNPAPTFPAQCADRISAAFNPQLATWKTSPAAVEIEAHVIRSVAERLRLPRSASGHFTTGGAEANYTALICALTRSCLAFASEGARAFSGPPVFYISMESHFAWFKIAHQAGIGRSAVRLVPTDGTGRLDANALATLVATDRAQGCVPVMIVATAGTTSAGMIDPLADCGEIARSSGIWYHVDAAWGGALIASEKLRDRLGGIEEADSVTIDAHKWFATTMGCGMFLIRNASILSSAFHVLTSYMPSQSEDIDPYLTSMQWSRRFLGLRLFVSLATAGWTGYAPHVERSINLIGQLKEEEELLSRGWSIANEPSLAVLCVEPPQGCQDIREIVDSILASGRAWVSTATFEGRPVIRACVTHGETTPNDITLLVDMLATAARAPIKPI